MKNILFVFIASFILGVIATVISLALYKPLNRAGSTVIEDDNKVLDYSGNSIKIILTGDVMLGRTVMIKSLDLKDPAYPFRKVADKLQEADIVLINLENPIIENCPRHEGGFKFCAPPSMVQGLLLAGVDIANLVNNHSGNYGEEGIKETIEILGKVGISAIYKGIPIIKGYNNVTFGFLGFDFTVNSPSKNDYQLIMDLDRKVDVLVVSVHWGVEYTARPVSYQKTWAKNMIVSGADVIYGHHPHWVQGEEYIDGKPVYFSLGNFVFDQMWSENTKKGMVVGLTFDERGNLIKEEKLRTYMNFWAQPEFVLD